MEPVRIIPCLDMLNGRVVKGVHFVELKDVADPVEAAKAYCEQGADEIAFLDITATVEGRQTMFEVARKVADVIDCPFTIGGGIKSLEDIRAALEAGATCASISSAAFRDPAMIAAAVTEFGGNTITVAIDADANDALPSGREVYIDGGRTATGKDATEFAKEMAAVGVGQILPTSKKTDGTTAGYDLQLTREIAEATDLPIIASGGAGTLEDFYLAATEGKANGLLAASVFHYGTFTVKQVKDYLKEKGVPVRE